MTRYNPARDDAELIRFWKLGLDDYQIAGKFGWPASTITHNRRRLGLEAQRTVPPSYETDARVVEDKPNPLSVARIWLGKRFVEKQDAYWLDGAPATLAAIMRAYNRMQQEAGAEQIGPEHWRVT